MRIPRHWLLAIGGAALIASIAVFAASINSSGTALAGNGSSTAEPTGEGTVEVTVTERPASTHTPTPEPTEGPTEPPATEPAEPTTAPATSTPSGDAGAGGVAPPNTGFGDTGDSGSSGLWVLLLGGALAAAGVGATAAGLRSR